jgi:hypothetical protein
MRAFYGKYTIVAADFRAIAEINQKAVADRSQMTLSKRFVQ